MLTFDIQAIKKSMCNRVPLGATLFSTFFDFGAILGASMTCKTSKRLSTTHSSGGHPRAAQDLCDTAHEQCKTAFNTRPERSRPPRTSQTSKMTPKVDGVPLRASILGPTWMHLDPLTQLLCDFVRGAVAGSQLCCAVDNVVILNVILLVLDNRLFHWKRCVKL